MLKPSIWLRAVITSITTGIVSTAAMLSILFTIEAVGWAPSEPYSRWAVIAFAVVTAVVAAAVAYFVAARQFARRVIGVNRLVAQKIDSDELDIVVPGDEDDELGLLVHNLNRLGQLYRLSLDSESRRADELAVLDLLVTTINRTLDLQEVLDTSLREVLRAIQWDVGAIHMWDDRSQTLNMVSYIGLSEDTVRQNISYRLGEGFIGRSAEKREVVIAYPGQDLAMRDVAPAPGWPETQISLPLVAVPGQLLGTLIMGSLRPKTLKTNELRLLTTVAGEIALAIDKAQLYTKVSEHAVELESLVAARTEQLSQAIDELWIALKQAREADRIKSLLLSTVSHELRTPLATIKGSTSLLIAHADQIAADQRLEHLRDIEEEADKLTELISNLLEMSRIEAGTLHIQPQPVDLVQILRPIISKARMRLKDHIVEVEAPRRPLTCVGDVRRIEQIVANLLDNAAKYSAPNSAITVTLRKEGDDAIVSVADQGIGISEEHIDRIFERFYQANMSSDSGRHGIGLGLAICKGLVDAQGGRIWVESKVGSGSKFSFSLPLLKRPAADGRG